VPRQLQDYRTVIDTLQGLRLTTVAVLDRLGSFIGRPVRYLPNSAGPGELAVGATEDALYGLELMTPRAELYRSRGGHYDVYEGGKDHDNVLRTEVDFLHRHLGP
jgi:hypothetical protein